MTRVAAGDFVSVKPSNNVYTVLVVAATIATILGTLAVVLRYSSVFDKGMFS